MLGKTLLALTVFAGTVLSAPAQLHTRVIYGVEWSVTGFNRVCTTYPNSCTYTFTIVPGGYAPSVDCKIVDSSYNPVHNNLASVPCNGGYANEWVISWGYNAAYDFAVMTIVNENEKYDAWFGYNSVSTTTKFDDVGPNDVYALGTFT